MLGGLDRLVLRGLSVVALGLDRLVSLLVALFPHGIRLLIIKDLRLFRRDPAQWSQFLIFFGLLLPVLRQRPPLQLQHPLFRLGEHDQLPQRRRRRAVDVDVHHAVHLSHDQPGRPPVLAPGSLARPPRYDPLEQVAFAVGGSLVPCSALILLSDTSAPSAADAGRATS